MRRQDWLGMSPEQVQVEEESLLKAREMDLDVLAQDNSRLLGDIAKVFTQSQCLMQSQSQCLVRELAVRVLQAEVTQQLLDLDALYPAQVLGVPGVVCEPIEGVTLHPTHENSGRLSWLLQMGESSTLSCRRGLFLRGKRYKRMLSLAGYCSLVFRCLPHMREAWTLLQLLAACN